MILRTISGSAIASTIVGLAACAQSPTAPSTTAGGPAALEARAPSAPEGFYTLTFLHYGQEVTTLVSGSYETSHVLVKVHVEDVNHQPAQSGSVLYEVCIDKNTGKGAASAACADGTARWNRWVDIEVNSNGDTWAGVDVVRSPCTMGWRATYRGSKTIAPAAMGPVDFVWT